MDKFFDDPDDLVIKIPLVGVIESPQTQEALKGLAKALENIKYVRNHPHVLDSIYEIENWKKKKSYMEFIEKQKKEYEEKRAAYTNALLSGEKVEYELVRKILYFDTNYYSLKLGDKYISEDWFGKSGYIKKKYKDLIKQYEEEHTALDFINDNPSINNDMKDYVYKPHFLTYRDYAIGLIYYIKFKKEFYIGKNGNLMYVLKS